MLCKGTAVFQRFPLQQSAGYRIMAFFQRSNLELHKTEYVRGLRVSMDPRKIIVHKVPFDEDRILVRHECSVLHPVKSECGNYFTVESEDLDMLLSEVSLNELKDAFCSVLRIMWRRYVLGDPKKMTQGALEFRKHLSEIYQLI